MKNPRPSARKCSDEDVVKLNSLGLSLATIGEELGVHGTTVKNRLDNLGIAPADTRRSFMEDIWRSLTPEQKEWLTTEVGPNINIKDYVKNLIVSEFLKR